MRVNKADAFVVECLGSTLPSRSHEQQLPESVVLKEFTDLNGKKLTNTQHKTIVNGGFGYRVTDINSFEADPIWTVKKDIKIDYSKVPRRISEEELKKDFTDTDGKALDIGAIRKYLSQVSSNSRY